MDTFVGRLDELSMLAGIRARALEGRRQAVVLTGEAGVGKTWLCERTSVLAEREGFEVVRGRCWPHGGAPALWPWPALLPALTGEEGARLLASDAGGDVVGAERFARFAAVADLLMTSRRNIPTMIVIDDVHYADASTLLLTRFLVHALDRLPLVLLLATRPGVGADELLTELQRDATTVTLRPFGLEDSAALLSAHGLRDADDETVKVLLDMTGGNPLHLAQAARTGTSHVTAENAIAGAIGRLDPRVQRILAFAALLGVDGTAGEVAALVGTTQAAVVQALTSSGLLQQGHDGLRFHDLVREAALAVFDHAEWLDAHAAAAKLLAGSTERVAHHAFAAAHRSPADAEFAITACRKAAASLRRGYAYEQAAELLDRAVDLSEHVHTMASRAELLIERADAVLACGRLTDARAAYEVGAEAAELSGNPVLLARAVLGLGGVWVHQYRNDTVRKRVLAQQRAALRALPEEERGLRCLLKVRLAAEAYYEGGSVQDVLDALAETRASGDEHALAEALSLTHHAMLAPEHASKRMALAEEQIVAASAAGDGMLALVGLLWLTADRYLLGDPGAERSLTELRQQSAALGVATTRYLVTCMDVMHLIRAGRLADAEDAAAACLQEGVDVGDADAPGYYGGQLLSIRWFQGRVGELAELVTSTLVSTSLAKPEYGFRASAVLILARDGRLTEARAALAPLLDIGLANLQSTSSWLTAMVGLIEAAAVLDDPGLAGEAADLIRPFAGLPVMPSLATSCFGAASRAIGLAELTLGNTNAAVTYLEQAVRDNLRLGHRPANALSRAQLAEALIARGRPGDLMRARELLGEAADDARKMDMSQRADEWQAKAADLDPVDASIVLRRESSGWTVQIGQNRIGLPDMVGLHYLSLLLEQPGRDIPAFDMSSHAILEARQDLQDDPAVAAFRTRLRALDEAIGDADRNADLGTAARLRLERESVAGELAGAVGRFPDSPERARTSVRKALKRAIDAIADADPLLGEELRTGVSTGYVCRFTPEDPASRQWLVERPQ
ncbi:tetratricopeptide (TPR) repeat protein [Kibdelosporangium banguiense]|uniref:Tetratricopeptide (TPR) repeat protein n=1 Tax=Kibdelosporangium banguiense TaxID=1365924 RepID=A0ABS4TL97_9PSEU|nr:AAA family ATPase [Kibdelosporangium banguiense]MBP2325161.1 tetratricopeptide (TPR) repeat protein [Kibdelosporangium banguiense]